MKNISFAYDYIEYYVGMAKMVAYWHIKALGFRLVAQCGPETGMYEKISFYLVKNDIKIVITSAYQNSSYNLVSFVDRHGNGVKRIAVRVDDVFSTFEAISRKGAVPIEKPRHLKDSYGQVEYASVKLFDDNEIVFINYGNYGGIFLPGYEASRQDIHPEGDSLLQKVDHIAHALRENESEYWASYINNIFNTKVIQEFKRGEISTDKAGLTLKVLQSDEHPITNVLVEPVSLCGRSQIQEYLDLSHGNGVQHVAYLTEDIIETVAYLKKAGVEFNTYPDSYYRLLEQEIRKAGKELNVEKLKEFGILCDLEDDSYLLQIFTKPIGDRPTFFYEIIQRVDNHVGFGLGNVGALFKSVELEQEKRQRVEERS